MSFLAKFKGRCASCQKTISVGQLIDGRNHIYTHVVCGPEPIDSDESPTICLLCSKTVVPQTFKYGEDDFAEEFYEAYDRRCGDDCECGGQKYHINDFCSLECVVNAIEMFESE